MHNKYCTNGNSAGGGPKEEQEDTNVPDDGGVKVALAEVGGGRRALLEAVVKDEHTDGDGEQTGEHKQQIPEAEPATQPAGGKRQL